MRRPRQSEAGLSMVELMIALAIVSVALFGLMAVILHTGRVNSASREKMLAMRAAEQQVEQLMTVAFNTRYANYNSGAAPGPWFDVPGLVPIGGPANQRVGKVLFPTLNVNSGAYTGGTSPLPPGPASMLPGGLGLYERESGIFMDRRDVAGAPVPLDLDGDGDTADGQDKSGSYRILPVVIQLSWRGSMGNTHFTYRHIFLTQ